MAKFHATLESLGACAEAYEWVEQFPTAQKAWNACQRGDWMLWLIGRTINCEPWSDGRKALLACSLDCAETARHLWPQEERVQMSGAVSVLRQWIAGTAAGEEAKAARNSLSLTATAAYAAAATSTAAAADAAAAAANAAYADAAAAASRTAYTAYAAASSAAAAAACAAAAAAASATSRQQTADIVRQHYPKPPT